MSNQSLTKKKELVSVVIPTYNREQYIGSCISSVLNQTYGKQNIQVIVIDDGSTDGTHLLVHELQKHHKNIVYEKIINTGNPGAVRNIGIKQARGNYIAFLDSDDAWLPDLLEKEITLLKETNAALIWSNADVVDHDNKLLKSRYLRIGFGKSGYVFNCLVQDNFVITSTTIVTRAVLDSVGAFMDNDKYKLCQDYDLWLRIALNNRLVYLDEVLAHYRQHPGGISKLNSNRAVKDIIIALRHQFNFPMSKDQRKALIMSICHKYRVLFESAKPPLSIIYFIGWFYLAVTKKVLYNKVDANITCG